MSNADRSELWRLVDVYDEMTLPVDEWTIRIPFPMNTDIRSTVLKTTDNLRVRMTTLQARIVTDTAHKLNMSTTQFIAWSAAQTAISVRQRMNWPIDPATEKEHNDEHDQTQSASDEPSHGQSLGLDFSLGAGKSKKEI